MQLFFSLKGFHMAQDAFFGFIKAYFYVYCCIQMWGVLMS